MSTDSREAARDNPSALLVVVMGVSAVGKSTVGRLLASRLDLEYADADDFHSQSNIAKMSRGEPLDDDDRWPWLESIGNWLGAHRETGAVVSCSALKRSYRDVLVRAAPTLRFVHLDGDPDIIRERIAVRGHHFMPASLLDSQLATLEPLGSDEPGARFDIDGSPDQIVDEFLDMVRDWRHPTG